MDKKRLKVLKDIGYTIQKSCGICMHSFVMRTIKDLDDNIGNEVVCGIHLDGEGRALRINTLGSCDTNFEFDEGVVKDEWKQFVDRRKFTRNNRHKQKVSY